MRVDCLAQGHSKLLQMLIGNIDKCAQNQCLIYVTNMPIYIYFFIEHNFLCTLLKLEEYLYPMCVIYGERLENETIVPGKVKRHLHATPRYLQKYDYGNTMLVHLCAIYLCQSISLNSNVFCVCFCAWIAVL